MKDNLIAVAMSGGVDSSLVAYELNDKGYKLFGITMKHLDLDEDEKEKSKTCCSLNDIYDSKKICNELKISHYTINLKDHFREKVMNYFINNYKLGNTPNPCVMCNKKIKLGELFSAAEQLGATHLATGHYAIIKDGKLYQAVDEHKDQSYFLSQIDKKYLKKLMFPLGTLTKDIVREKSQIVRSRTADKEDSQGVCFIKNNDYKSFFEKVLNEDEKRKGEIIDSKGNFLGYHEGVQNYTVGQRKGIGVSSSEAYYVLRVEPINNRIIVGKNEEVFKNSLVCDNINLLIDEDINYFNNLKCFVKTRARDNKNEAMLKVSEDKIYIEFAKGVRAITPGQVAVFYTAENKVLGSGIIL